MPLLNRQYYTIADIYALPEGKRAELIEGEILIWRHQVESIKKSSRFLQRQLAII